MYTKDARKKIMKFLSAQYFKGANKLRRHESASEDRKTKNHCREEWTGRKLRRNTLT